MRRKMVVIMALVMLVSSAGCSTLPKKFIRKKKEPAHKPATVFLQQEGGAYQKQFSNAYYYKTHYTLWRSWHDDIIGNLNGNSKKLSRAAEEAYSHLDQMAKYLKPEKEALLSAHVNELNGYRKTFSDGHYTKSDAGPIRTQLERIKRQVQSDFYFDKVEADLLPDQVDLHE